MSSSTPSIRISQHQRYASPPSYYSIPPTITPSPMAVPRAQEPVPPPLPPPTIIPELASGRDPGWQWGNDPSSFDFGRAASVKPGSSLLGGNFSNRQEKEFDYTKRNEADDGRRGSSITTITGTRRDHDMTDDNLSHSDEDGPSRRASNYRLQSERRLEQTTLEGSSQAYDKQLLSRIGGPNTPNSRRQSSISFPAGMQETAQLANAESERRNSQLRPLAMPGHERRHSSIASIDSPAISRWPSMSGAISPSFTGFWENGLSADSSRAHTRQGSFMFDESASNRGSYDHSMFSHDDFPIEENQMRSLNIHDRSPGSDDSQARAGTKRRASSPPRDLQHEDRSSVSSASGQNDLYHRRSMQHLPNRGSPVSRFHPSQSSLSSASSYGPRNGSLGSTLSIPSAPSSATSYGSGRVSPNALSPALDPELRHYGMKELIPSPILSNPQHQRTFSENAQVLSQRTPAPDSAPHSRQSSLSQLHGLFICECCPKKPKKFESEEELRTHESEKQYTCAYCPNRFKNKNEAERHQNSLHLRNHSWSCAALAGPQAAFHTSLSGNGADICGYCGDEYPNPPDWDARADHLNHVHKFGECNKAKKFFRADHFRQHLKHSHAGTSGKWTNMLENACMKDEPLPEKRTTATTTNGPGGQAPPALMVTTTGLCGQHSRKAVVIDEPHEC